MSEEEKTEMVEQEEVKEPEPQPEPEQPEEEFDKERAMATIKNLRKFEKEAKKLQDKIALYEQEQDERKKAELSEIDRLTLEKREAEQKLAELTRKELQRTVAEQTKLPMALADRIKGETPEEMEADALRLVESLPKPGKPSTGVANPGSQASEQKSWQEPRIDPFDPAVARSTGGGVFIPK